MRRKQVQFYVKYDEAIDVLDSVREGSNGWSIAVCPAHADSRPSLSIKEGDYGELIVHCFSGCAKKEVIDAIKELINE